MSPTRSPRRRSRNCPGTIAIGHVRYSTAGDSNVDNAQPILIECAHGQIAIAHNGNLVNASELKDELGRHGAIFQTSTDTEVILHLYARSRAVTTDEAIVEAISHVQGAFSLALMTKDRLIAVRDPHGFRPLALGRLGDAVIVCSETCALDLIGATYVRDVEPGEVVIVSAAGVKSFKPFAPAPSAQCVFEHVYFARPDSYVFGESVNEVRTNLGRLLAREQPVEADVIVPVPDSGVCAAIGFAEESGIPMRVGLIRNHYVGRTFIEPQQSIRHFGVRVKLNPVRSILEGRRVVLVDDSLVRGHDQPQDRQDGEGRRREGSAHAHQLPADDFAVFLRRRHAAPIRADRGDPYARRDSEIHRRRQRGVSQPRGAAVCGRHAPHVLLHVLLHRAVSGGIPAQRGRVSAAGAETRYRCCQDIAFSCSPSRLRWPGAGRCVAVRRRRRSARCAQERGPQPMSAEAIQAAIDSLGNLDFPVRMNASRALGARRPTLSRPR